MEGNLKVVWAEFSTLSQVVLLFCSISTWYYTQPLLELKTRPSGLSCQLKFIHVYIYLQYRCSRSRLRATLSWAKSSPHFKSLTMTLAIPLCLLLPQKPVVVHYSSYLASQTYSIQWEIRGNLVRTWNQIHSTSFSSWVQ